jgi:hypothetical protein
MSDLKLKLALFPVKEKTSDKGPDQTGAIEIPAGEIGELIKFLNNAPQEEDWQGNRIIKLPASTWINEMKDGRKYLRGSVSAPYNSDATPVAASSVSSEDLPF